MAQYHRQRKLFDAVDVVQVAVTDAAGSDFHQYLPPAGSVLESTLQPWSGWCGSYSTAAFMFILWLRLKSRGTAHSHRGAKHRQGIAWGKGGQAAGGDGRQP